MASVIANQFGEADGLKLSALIAIGLLLFIITAIINLIAKLVMKNIYGMRKRSHRRAKCAKGEIKQYIFSLLFLVANNDSIILILWDVVSNGYVPQPKVIY